MICMRQAGLGSTIVRSVLLCIMSHPTLLPPLVLYRCLYCFCALCDDAWHPGV
jgi:hypothetical protein